MKGAKKFLIGHFSQFFYDSKINDSRCNFILVLVVVLI